VAKGKKFTSPSYLQSTPHGYYFRYKVPPDVRPVIGRTELESSLRTGKLSETKEQSAKSDYHDVSEPVEWLLADNGLDVNKESEVYGISLISDEYGLYFMDNFSQISTIQSNPEPKPGACQPS